MSNLQQIIEHASLEFVRIFYLNSTREDDSEKFRNKNFRKKSSKKGNLEVKIEDYEEMFQKMICAS